MDLRCGSRVFSGLMEPRYVKQYTLQVALRDVENLRVQVDCFMLNVLSSRSTLLERLSNIYGFSRTKVAVLATLQRKSQFDS